MINEREPTPHPSRLEWETFLDEERNLEDASSELAHLESCERCRASVRYLIEEEETKRRLLREDASRRTAPAQEPIPHPPVKLLSDYAHWLVHYPAGEEIIREVPQEYREIETHIESCDTCLNGLISLQKIFVRLNQD